MTEKADGAVPGDGNRADDDSPTSSTSVDAGNAGTVIKPAGPIKVIAAFTDKLRRGFWDEIRIDPFAATFDLLDSDRMAEMALDIETKGLQTPIDLDQYGVLIDGRNRLECFKLIDDDTRPDVIVRSETIANVFTFECDEERIQHIRSRNTMRRQTPGYRRAFNAYQVANATRGGTQGNQITQAQAARLHGVGITSIERWSTIMRACERWAVDDRVLPYQLRDKVLAGDMSLKGAASAARSSSTEDHSFPGGNDQGPVNESDGQNPDQDSEQTSTGRYSTDYAKEPASNYPSPRGVIRALLKHHPSLADGIAWEPCAGSGRLVDQMKAEGMTVLAQDLHDRGHPDVKAGKDFFLETVMPAGCDLVITNPPYSIPRPVKGNAEKTRPEDLVVPFLEHCRKIGAKRVAVLLRWHAICPQDREPFRQHLLAPTVVMGRLQMIPEGAEQKGTGGKEDFAWFVFSFEEPNGVPPIVREDVKALASNTQDQDDPTEGKPDSVDDILDTDQVDPITGLTTEPDAALETPGFMKRTDK